MLELLAFWGNIWNGLEGGRHAQRSDRRESAPVQMFPSRDPQKSARLMATMDGLNSRFGLGMVGPAVSGVERRWAAKAEHLSPRCTTRLKQLISVLS